MWFDNIFDIDPSVIAYKFARVFFLLISSQFLLNETLKVHFSKLLHQQKNETLLEKLLRDLYMDDLVSSFNETSKDILSMGDFELRKRNTNCERLKNFINNDMKEALDKNCIKKILGLAWNIVSDEFIFYFTGVDFFLLRKK